MGRTFAFGSTGNRPGTLVKLTTPDKPATGSPFGSTVQVGAYPRGPVGRMIGGLKSADADRILGLSDMGGGFVGDIQACLAARHMFSGSEGAATLYALRVTDGNERAASLALYDRDVDTSYAVTRAAAKLVGMVGTVSASNGGRWGGQALAFGGKVLSVSGAISGSVWDTDLRKAAAAWPFSKDELKGAAFAIEGESRTWVIESNDDDGYVTVVGDFVGVTATDGRWRVRAENVDANGAMRGLGLLVADGTQDPDAAFRVVALENRREKRADIDNLKIDPADGSYFESIIQQSLEASQYEITAADAELCTAVDRDEKKPANWAGIALPGQVTARTVKFRILEFQVTGTGDGYVGTLVNGGAMVPHKYVLTVKSGATDFTVAAYDLAGERLLASDLPDGTIGSAYAAPHSFLSGFTVTNGSGAFIEGDVINVYVRPLPVSAGGTGLLPKLGGWFYPYAFGSTGTGSKDVTTRYRVYSNTYDTITLGPNDDVSEVVIPPAAPLAIGSVAWDTTKDTLGKTFIYNLGAGAVTLTMTGDATQSLADAIDELNTLAGAGTVTFYAATSGGHSYLAYRRDDGVYGPDYSLAITDGTLNAVVGFTSSSTTYGAAPTVGRLEFSQDLEGGRDGVAELTASNFVAVWDAEDSPVLALRTADVGAVEMQMPGVTDPVAQQAMIAFAPVIGFMARVEVPSTVISAAAARKWARDNLTPNDFFRVAFPSYGYLASNPMGARTKFLCTLSGGLAGLRARYARDYAGYHKPAADTAALLSPLFSSLATDRSNGEAVELDEDLLNGFGFEIIRHVGPSIYRFAAKIPGENWKWGWGHKVECLLHIKQELLVAGDPLAFQVIDGPLGQTTRLMAYSVAKKIMEPHEQAGWFKDGFTIKCDSQNNTTATADAGRLLCDASADIVNTADKVEFSIGQKAVVTAGGSR